MRHKYMYKFCFVMFILSTLGVFINVGLIIMNKTDANDYIRAVSLLIFSSIFYTLMLYYKKKSKRDK